VLPGQDGAATQEVHGPALPPIMPETSPVVSPPPDDRTTQGRPAHRAPRKGRRATPIAAGLVVVLAAGLLGLWTLMRDNASGDVLNTCRVNFYIHPNGDGVFDARLTVVNTGGVSHKPASMVFVFGTQHIIRADGVALAQESGAGGYKITLSGFELPAGKAITLGLVGQTGAAPGPPSGFSLNGVTCANVRLLGDPLPPTTGVAAPPADLDAPHSPPAPPPGFPPPPRDPPPGWPSNSPWPPPGGPPPPPWSGNAPLTTPAA
jgi:hypothetical protein